MQDFLSDFLRIVLKQKATSKKKLHALKKDFCKHKKIALFPDADLLQACTPMQKKRLLFLLQKKPTRTLSGVSVVAVMTRPSKCPHGRCVYCCGGLEVSTPQSYTGREPAAMRGSQFGFDPAAQVDNRVTQLERIGHPTDKVELIIMGGTFTAQPRAYQASFVKNCFESLNQKQAKGLEAAQKTNEHAKHRCIGLTVETRPDEINSATANRLLSFGTTRVELGVQNPDDRIYELVKRGHTVADAANATRLCKDSFLKVGYHLMPNLPGSSLRKDLKMFRTIFEDERFKPDMIKIYPCLLIDPNYGKTELFDMWKRGEWKPYSEQQTARLIAQAKNYFPRWVRVMRVQRDIPSQLILAGVKHSNLRQLVQHELEKQGAKCNCIRCREVRSAKLVGKPRLERQDYEASGGSEVFLSFEDSADKLLGFLRLRACGAGAGVRELHVYGQEAAIGKAGPVQHRGLGATLLAEAEKIAREEFDAHKLLVCSGVGAREYYRRFGYKLKKPYMAKQLY